MKAEEETRKGIEKAVNFIKRGGVVIFPTDTVYGFIADAGNKKAVENIFRIKKRSRKKPLAVFVKNIEAAKQLAEINNKQEKILKQYWPGRFTFVLKRKKINKKLYGLDKSSLALRVPNYKPLNDLLRKINKPLVQTSVNVSGKKPLNKVKEIITQFKNSKIPIILINAGDLKNPKPSQIIDLTKTKNRLIRR